MKKSLTFSLVFAGLAGSILLAATNQTVTPKRQHTSGETRSSVAPDRTSSVRSSKSMTGKVTEVNNQAETFTVAVVLSSAQLGNLPADGEIIDITYTETPGGGPLRATTVKSSKSNSSERVRSFRSDSQDRTRSSAESVVNPPLVMTGKVTEVNDRAKTFTVAVDFSAASLGVLPAVGEVIDITYTEPTGGGPLETANINSSKSNVN